MNAEPTTAEVKSHTTTGAPVPPAPFGKPSPGSWALDTSHCERPLPRFVHEVFTESFMKGFREGLESYGALLESIDMAAVNGFIYSCVRPIGAPPEAKGMPPKLIFKLVSSLHPEIRRRVKRSEEAMDSRRWREELSTYENEWAPPIDRERERLLERAIHSCDYDGNVLADYLDEVHRHLADAFFVHHRMNVSRVVPVGDFMVHAREWTGASVKEVLEILRGSSPGSREGLSELDALATLIREDADLLARVCETGDPEMLLRDLEGRPDAIGAAARTWLAKVGHQVTGFSPGYPTLRETPATLVEALRGMLASRRNDDAHGAAQRSLEQLRSRVPEIHRESFDRLLEEARSVYYMRDHLCFKSLASCGLARLALLEAGRRLTERGLVSEPEAALDATVSELRSLLTTGIGPSRDELGRHLDWRRTATMEHAPELLGPPPGSPPPDDWLPKGAQRFSRAINEYLRAMTGEWEGGNRESTIVRGLPASGGKRTGTARLVLEPGDFDRIGKGDVLIARITTPTYNVLLPLLAGIVTDRGGVLSHPAIVSREYGIPGVVGCRNATSMIPDGATVEIDGDAGTVRVLS